MVINRRHFMQLMMATPFFTAINSRHHQEPKLISAGQIGRGFVVFMITHEGQHITIPIPFRPHALTPLPEQKLLVIGKRPSDLMAVVDLHNKQIEKTIRLPFGRHFWGHAVIDTKNNCLLATEYNFELEQSIISQWCLDSWTSMKTFPCHGVAGHDIFLNNQQIVCANGGFKSAPEFGRTTLPGPIHSTITVLDRNSHQLLKRIPMPDSMSARHLCNTKDHIYVGLQNKTKENHFTQTTLLQLNKANWEAETIMTEPAGTSGHITSLKAWNDQWVVATSHLNDSIHVFNPSNQAEIKTFTANKPQGIHCAEQGFLVTTQDGLLFIDHALQTTSLSVNETINWENHCV